MIISQKILSALSWNFAHVGFIEPKKLINFLLILNYKIEAISYANFFTKIVSYLLNVCNNRNTVKLFLSKKVTFTKVERFEQKSCRTFSVAN